MRARFLNSLFYTLKKQNYDTPPLYHFMVGGAHSIENNRRNPEPEIPTAGLAGIPPTAEATLHLVIHSEAAICYTNSESWNE